MAYSVGTHSKTTQRKANSVGFHGTNRINDGVEAVTRKSQATFQII